MLLIHGWGASAESWAAHMPQLNRTHRVTAVDLPGHGAAAANSTTTIPGIVHGLAATLRGPTVVVGHSMGAQIAVLLARDHPELVRAVVVVDPAFGATEEELAGCPDTLADLRLRGAEAAAEFVDRACDPRQAPELWKAARQQMLATDETVLADLYQSMYLDDGAIGGRAAAEACLAKLRVPVLALYSNAAVADQARSLPLPPGSRVVAWPGRTHYLHQEEPTAFCDLLLEFIG